MAAGVHPARDLGGVGCSGLLLHGEGVHVRAEADGGAGPVAVDDRDDAGCGDAFMHLVHAEFAQAVGHEAGRAVAVEAQFRVLVEVAAPGGHVLREGGDPVDDGHGWTPLGGPCDGVRQ
ncbi:MAG: hypothetical protein AVDCRST_MAG15-2262 [uncultured Rubellimicrobium sp.]|uniref:Uncharacterized protein n=1 Tax=uncultured Rubellimicrobium sp. TaxID=543078 RepID=A0A6J4PXD4_9RHOB|nr:MAG: hypothetical protein AVDCRST_MAG15-2262 [uncultured Rubellimicrobium sp.]